MSGLSSDFKKDESDDRTSDNDVEDDDIVTLAPSHILQDGRFVFLPVPTDRERVRFFERSIAQHGLLEDDLRGKKDADVDAKKENESNKKKDKEPQIHPLALASAKIQSDGINELNRAINLQMLASSGEYFGLCNVVDPSLELLAASASSSAAAVDSSKGDGTEKSDTGGTSASGQTAAEKLESDREVLQEQNLRAMFILKRKRSQFHIAGRQILRRHRRRLAAAIVAQSLPDRRLRELRPFWRLVAPEHGTRALPHAARPTEVVAADVDVYRKGEGVTLGRLASRVPRYATIELQDDYKVDHDLQKWKKYLNDARKRKNQTDGSDHMALDDHSGEDLAPKVSSGTLEIEGLTTPSMNAGKVWTRAEPFAIADPALGKLDADFDPNKVSMLTLQFDIEKTSTGFVQSACMEPIAGADTSNTSGDKFVQHKEDEMLLVALQHSLFCAKLFESIRRELAPDTEDIGQVRTSARQSVVWLSGESDENFLPPASLMSGDRKSRLESLCVVHIHEGDVKVLLDCEYALRVRLVEAGETLKVTHPPVSSTSATSASGSQSAAQLLALCHALLLHAQETYHRHSVRMEAKLRREEEQERNDTTKLTAHQLQQKQQAKINQLKAKDNSDSPRILASCVSLGTKMLFERRIRVTLQNVKLWLTSRLSSNINDDGNVPKLVVEWLSLSIFDFSAHFTVSYRHWAIDATIVGDELTVTQFGKREEDGTSCYSKAKFHTDQQFELFLKLSLRKISSQKTMLTC